MLILAKVLLGKRKLKKAKKGGNMKVVGSSNAMPKPGSGIELIEGKEGPKLSEKAKKKIEKAENAKADMEGRARKKFWPY